MIITENNIVIQRREKLKYLSGNQVDWIHLCIRTDGVLHSNLQCIVCVWGVVYVGMQVCISGFVEPVFSLSHYIILRKFYHSKHKNIFQ